jgi:hypothetical protein
MNTELGFWAFIVGLILAVIFGIISYAGNALPSWATIALIIVGLIVGFLNISDEETTTFLLAGLVLLATYASLGPFLGALQVLGTILNNILGAIATVVAPAAFIVAFKAVWTAAKSR